MFDIISFIPRAVVQGIPLLLGSTGETLTPFSMNRLPAAISAHCRAS